MHIVAIVGSRFTNKETKTEFTDYKYFCKLVDDHIKKMVVEYADLMIISGGARGTDSLAKQYALEHSFPFIPFPPEYDKYIGEQKKLAPIHRNTVIANKCDSMIAIQINGSAGTKDVVSKAIKLQRNVIKLEIKL